MKTSTNLIKQFESLEKFCDGQLGVSAHHIETGNIVHFNADQRFMMCSTYKVAIAIYLLHLAEKNEIDINELCIISKDDFLPGVVSKKPDKERKQDPKTESEKRRAMTWAQRLKRAFNIDISVCEACGGQARVVACYSGSCCYYQDLESSAVEIRPIRVASQ